MTQLYYLKIPNYNTKSSKTTLIQLSYQTFGRSLNNAPIVLVNHALTGNSQVIGKNGWWNDLIEIINVLTQMITAFWHLMFLEMDLIIQLKV